MSIHVRFSKGIFAASLSLLLTAPAVSLAADAKDAKSTKELGVTDDRDGSAMRYTAEVVEDPCNKMSLADLVQGYDVPGECGK